MADYTRANSLGVYLVECFGWNLLGREWAAFLAGSNLQANMGGTGGCAVPTAFLHTAPAQGLAALLMHTFCCSADAPW